MSELVKKIRNTAIVAGVVAIVGLTGYSYFVSDTVETRISDAQMAKVDDKYMVATDVRPFQNTDAWYRFKFNSGDIQNEAIRLKGKNVQITKYGWRSPMLSMYENIVDIKELK
jgi:hypothetical protein